MPSNNRVITEQNRKDILSTEIESWRRCYELTKMHRISIEEIRRRINTEYTEKKRLLWCNQIRKKFRDIKLINIVGEWSLTGKN